MATAIGAVAAVSPGGGWVWGFSRTRSKGLESRGKVSLLGAQVMSILASGPLAEERVPSDLSKARIRWVQPCACLPRPSVPSHSDKPSRSTNKFIHRSIQGLKIGGTRARSLD